MKNFVQRGDTFTGTAPYAVASGAGFLIGSMFAVAITTAANGAEVTGERRGVFSGMAKATGEAWTVGALLYWDNTNKRLTTTASGNKIVGYAEVAALSADTTGTAYIDGVAR